MATIQGNFHSFFQLFRSWGKQGTLSILLSRCGNRSSETLRWYSPEHTVGKFSQGCRVVEWVMQPPVCQNLTTEYGQTRNKKINQSQETALSGAVKHPCTIKNVNAFTKRKMKTPKVVKIDSRGIVLFCCFWFMEIKNKVFRKMCRFSVSGLEWDLHDRSVQRLWGRESAETGRKLS